MNCANPLEVAALADYWLAALPEFEEAAVEEHLFGCDACAARLDELVALAEGVRRVAREGSLQMVVSEMFLKRAAGEGLRVRQYAPPAGGSVQCTVTAEDDLLIGSLAANLSREKRVDLSLCDRHGIEQSRLSDIPFSLAESSVHWQMSITYAKAAPSETMIARLLGVGEAGEERLLGEYTFHHTRTIPGPAAW